MNINTYKNKYLVSNILNKFLFSFPQICKPNFTDINKNFYFIILLNFFSQDISSMLVE